MYRVDGGIIMKLKKIAVAIAVILCIVCASAAAYGYSVLNSVKTTKISKDPADLGIKNQTPAENVSTDTSTDTDEYDGKVINIALLGGDRRSSGEQGRSDAIIIASIDMVHDKIKLSSIMRDTYVDIYKHGKTKINHAFAYGGPELLIRTINENFGLDIKDYVYVDFSGLEKLIDSLGGVELDIKSAEIPLINKCIKEQSELSKTKPHYLKKPGKQLLNGQQAVGYARIRDLGNGDFDRTERQREVLTIMLNKIKDAGIVKYPFIASQMLPCVETSLDKSEIIKLGTYILKTGLSTIEQERFPMDKFCKGKIINKIWYLVYDVDATKNQIHQFIYDDIIPGAPPSPGQRNSSKPQMKDDIIN